MCASRKLPLKNNIPLSYIRLKDLTVVGWTEIEIIEQGEDIFLIYMSLGDRNSSVVIGTRYELDGPGIDSQ